MGRDFILYFIHQELSESWKVGVTFQNKKPKLFQREIKIVYLMKYYKDKY